MQGNFLQGTILKVVVNNDHYTINYKATFLNLCRFPKKYNMRPGKTKSRTLRRVYKRTTSGVKLTYEKRKPHKLRCSGCRTELAGIKRLRPSKLQNTPKTKKRPERPFGGVLCSSCMRQKIIQKARSQ